LIVSPIKRLTRCTTAPPTVAFTSLLSARFFTKVMLMNTDDDHEKAFFEYKEP